MLSGSLIELVQDQNPALQITDCNLLFSVDPVKSHFQEVNSLDSSLSLDFAKHFGGF